MEVRKNSTPVAACPRCEKSGTWMVYTSRMNASDHFSCGACAYIWTTDKQPTGQPPPKAAN